MGVGLAYTINPPHGIIAIKYNGSVVYPGWFILKLLSLQCLIHEIENMLLTW